MSEYFNTIKIDVADMVYLDFGIALNQNTNQVAHLVTTYPHIKNIAESLNKLIFDVEEKIKVAQTRTN